ncbi:MAG: thymidylate synthase [Nanoarchaeota archaeon]|nr:thymidylate synthase [Nanoarchaeota archaeon]
MTEQYIDHCREILTSPYSIVKGGSKEVPIVSLFGYQNEYDLSEGFPAVTTKRLALKSVIHELIWFMRGETNIKYLVDNGVPIWTRDGFNHNLEGMASEGIFPAGLAKYSPEWIDALAEYEQRVKEDEDFAARWGELGPVYGAQWRDWKSVGEEEEVVHVDQLQNVVETLRRRPTSKKIILSSWNAGDIGRMALEPCHLMFQVESDGEFLDLQMYQRSCDQFLGVPFNIASYAIATQVLAQQVGLRPRRFVHTFGNAHFYGGVGERGDWYRNPDNFSWLQEAVRQVRDPADHLNVLEDLQRRLPTEVDSDGNVLEGATSYDHVTAILEQSAREPYTLSRMEIADKPFDKLEYNDFKRKEYKSHPAIQRAMAV